MNTLRFGLSGLIRGVLALAVLASLSSSAVLAEGLRVFPGEYLVEPALAGLGGDVVGDSVAKQGFSVTGKLASGAVVVRSQLAAFGGPAADEHGAVAYDEATDDCERLMKLAVLRSCSPNYLVTTMATPSDPRLGESWGMNAGEGSDAYGAWDIHTGSEDVVVAVIDTGVEYTHQDLAANMWRNPFEVPGNGIDDDGNGYVDDVHGINAAAKNGNPMDDNGHGTHVAGVVGAVGNNGTGVAGVNWRVQVMALKFLTANGGGRLSDAIVAIDYMIAMRQRGVNVIVSNNSWGGGGFSSALRDAVNRAEQAGIVFAAAAGNEGSNNDQVGSYPGNYNSPNVVSVAALDRSQNLAGFSNFGATTVDIAAPGAQIFSTFVGNSYRSLSGTSMATPFVSGAIALLSAANPGLTPPQLIQKLYDSADPLATLQGVTVTGKKLNINRMLRSAGDVPFVPSPASCTYEVESISYDPSGSADTGVALVDSDEFGFHTLSLNTAVPFFSSEVSSLVLSPNGLVYVGGSAPSEADYQVGVQAPNNSIAALHSDLTAQGAGLGVRAVELQDRVVIKWDAVHYNAQQGQPLDAELVLFHDGTVETHVRLNEAAALPLFQNKGLLGLTGAGSGQAIVAASGAQIAETMAFRYNRVCTEATQPAPEPVAPTVRLIGASLFSVNKRGRVSSKIVAGRPGQLSLQSTSGDFTPVVAQFSVDGFSCSDQVPLLLTGTTTNFQFNTPSSMSKFRRLSVRVTGDVNSVEAKAKIRASKRARERTRRRRNSRRRSSIQRQRTKQCATLIRSFAEAG